MSKFKDFITSQNKSINESNNTKTVIVNIMNDIKVASDPWSVVLDALVGELLTMQIDSLEDDDAPAYQATVKENIKLLKQVASLTKHLKE
jgi:hypothetical protein